jgi:hypothetical protein
MKMFDDDGNNYSSEDINDIFKLVTVDRIRKVKITVKLVDEEGDEIPMRETIDQLMSYIKDKTKSDTEDSNNPMITQIMPLNSQALVAALPKIMGVRNTATLLSIESLRMSFVMMMMLSFSLLQFVKRKNLKIVTMEEPITDEEIERAIKLSKASSVASMGAMLGMNPNQIVKELMDKGLVDKEVTGEAGGPADVFEQENKASEEDDNDEE